MIPEEFETSIEIFSRVLHNYLVPINELENLISSIRANNYKMLQTQSRLPLTTASTRIPDFKITCVRLLTDTGSIVGKTIAEANIRNKYGVNILAISRKDQIINSITPHEKLFRNDMVFIIGNQEYIDRFYKAVS